MDSGLSLREPRNDEGGGLLRARGYRSLVIPEAAARGCPESITTIGSTDSGLSLREPRNDETNTVIPGRE